jgi:peptidoglycan/xylan/chitin deacetylase (PgdA/CDA1 family)
LRFVSPVLKHIVFPALSWSGYLRQTAGAGPAVVTYHGVFPEGYEIRCAALDGNLVYAGALRQQLLLLKKHYNLITPDEFLQYLEGELSLPPRSILLTCDDALRNTLTEMLPILKDLGLECLFFATGASADEKASMLWYDELYLMLLDSREAIQVRLPEARVRLEGIAPNERHATWWRLVEQLSKFDGDDRRKFLDQIREQLGLPNDWAPLLLQNPAVAGRFLMLDRCGLRQLADAGMTIGAHTLSHPILAQAPEDLAAREISESKRVLDEALGQTMWAFAYPFGTGTTVTERDVGLVEQAGFRCAFMNIGGGLGARTSAAKTSRFVLPRVHITADMELPEFEAHISGLYRSLRTRLLGETVG